MDIRETIEWMKAFKKTYKSVPKEVDTACDMAISALEKQIPKKPRFYDMKFRQRGQLYGEHVSIERAYNCPSCNLTVWKTDKNEHCHHCGQALDWEGCD